MSAEQLGYPTQKPLALLERIISAGSNEGDVVLDPFCGCGTTIAAAQKLGRRWIGIDVTHLSIALQKYRLTQMFPDAAFAVIGEPTTEQGARQLARDDRFQFQWWALSLIRARPYGGDAGSKKGKKGADRGIDGLITFIDEAGGNLHHLAAAAGQMRPEPELAHQHQLVAFGIIREDRHHMADLEQVALLLHGPSVEPPESDLVARQRAKAFIGHRPLRRHIEVRIGDWRASAHCATTPSGAASRSKAAAISALV